MQLAVFCFAGIYLKHQKCVLPTSKQIFVCLFVAVLINLLPGGLVWFVNILFQGLQSNVIETECIVTLLADLMFLKLGSS